jgi:hypothetical protein
MPVPTSILSKTRWAPLTGTRSCCGKPPSPPADWREKEAVERSRRQLRKPGRDHILRRGTLRFGRHRLFTVRGMTDGFYAINGLRIRYRYKGRPLDQVFATNIPVDVCGAP